MTGPTIRDNNFDLLRLLFAGSVFFWHAAVLTQAPALQVFGRFFSAEIRVKGFFVISGYLVTMSYENSASLRDYAQKRVRRIYPAYVAVVLACAAAGMFLTALPLAEYFSVRLAHYLAANLAFLNFLAPRLPGVFEAQAYGEVNGALWTLKIEVMYYLFVPVLSWLMVRFGRWRVLIIFYAAAVFYAAAMAEMHARSGAEIWLQLQRQLPGQLGYFLVGAILFFLRDRLDGKWGALLAAAAAIFGIVIAAGNPAVSSLLEPLALGALVVYAAIGLPPLGNFARFGDFSYGVYIVHFPVIQVLVALGMFATAPWTGFCVAAALVAVLSLASWHLIEKPFLARHSHYRRAEKA